MDLPELSAERSAGQSRSDASVPWWKTAVAYQIYPASFADSNGDGMGDLRGITAHLDYLADLGVDIVWLSPIYPTPWDDGGYDISDYQDVEPRFGTLADFDELLGEVHARGMKLILDLVPNHTSDEHPWFLESRSSTDNPKRDWYFWRPAQAGTVPGEPGSEPTNWLSKFSQPAWTFDPATGEYYLHLYSTKQPDLNWENPEVRAAICSMITWWLQRGVDGFRIDVVNKFSKVLPFRDMPSDGQPYVDAEPMYENGPRLHEFIQELCREALAPYRDRILVVGEASGSTVEDGLLFSDPARGELDMIFTFEHIRVDHGHDKFDQLPLDLVLLKSIMNRWQTGLAETGWNSLYWCNHDQPRIVSRWGDDGEYRVQSAKMLATVLHLQRGTPYIYQGEELGMTNAQFSSIDDFRDVASINYLSAHAGEAGTKLAGVSRLSRDNARSPMQWDDSPGAGFTVGEPWQRVNPNNRIINATAAVADPQSVWHHYKQLIHLRHTLPVVGFGDFTLLLPDDPAVYAFTRELDGTTLLVLGNFTGQNVPVDLPDVAEWASAELLLGNYPAVDGVGSSLRPWETRVYRRTTAAG